VQKLPVYLDNNATTACDPRVVEEMLPYFTSNYGNAASRSHSYGWIAEEAVDLARERVARLIGAEPKEIVFTSGATEADNLAIKGVFEMYAGKGNHIITCETEHKAVLDTCKHIQKLGAEITYLTVNQQGMIDLQQLKAAIRPTTILISLMFANNETGTIHPIREVSAIARKHNVLFFSDAAQAVGKIPVDVNRDGIDLMSLSGHKMYGPKGVGALYVRRRDPRVRLTAQMDGGGHERGHRSGTLNVPAIAGFGRTCEIACNELEEEKERISQFRNRLEAELLQIEGVCVNGSVDNRLPNVTNLSFEYVDGDALLMGLNKSVAVSSGSACTSASMEPSYVLKAMGVSDDLAHASIRFGIGRFTTREEIEMAIGKVTETVKNIRENSLVWEMYLDKKNQLPANNAPVQHN
jgi:cysteine desulfurase